METPQRFEGASIEEVLGRVRAELGTDAEIIEANKVRSGGIGGFFSKERFEVMALPVTGPSQTSKTSRPTPASAGRGRTVGPMLQGPLPAAATAPPQAITAKRTVERPTGAPVSLMDMADRVSAAETAEAEDVTAPLPRIDGLTPPDAIGSGPSQVDPSVAPARRSRAQQVAEEVMAEHLRRMGTGAATPDVQGFQPMQPAEMPRISTEGSAFTQVLQRIASDAGHDIAQAVAAQPAELERPITTPAPTPTVWTTTAVAPTGMADDVITTPIATLPTTPAAAPEEGQSFPAITEEASDPADTEAPTHLPVAQPQETDVTPSRTERLLSWLELDHLPQTTLMSALRKLPQMEALPMTRGVVVAVVGERSRALRLCRQLARASDGDPRDVVLASHSYRGSAFPEEQRIIDLDDAARDRRGWRRRTAPTFVAVESTTSLDPQAQAWTRDIIEALDAHQVIGVVRASRKAEDVRAWADVVGGVDGLALEELGETTTPYAVLALEIPVAFLGPEPATPTSWAQLLMERTAA